MSCRLAGQVRRRAQSALARARRVRDTLRLMSSTTRAVASISLLALTGCAGWPLYANLPQSDSAVLATEDTGSADTVDWSDGSVAEPTDDVPTLVTTLSLDQGIYAEGELDGVGWDPDLDPTREADCEGETVALAFPPLADGAYTGDVDWRGVAIAVDGVLCGSFSLEYSDTLVGVLEYDAVPYSLNTCGDPVIALSDDQGTAGLGERRATARWSVEVVAGDHVSVALAGVVPGATLTDVVPWRSGLALVAAAADGEQVACPSLPESL